MRTRQAFCCTLLLVLTAGLSGCVSIKVGDVGGGSGGWGHRSKGSYSVVRPIPGGRDALGVYTGIQIGRFADGTGGRVPPAFMNQFATALRKKLKDEDLPTRPGGRTLVVRGTLMRYGDADVIAGVQLVDAATSRVLGVANCTGSTGERNPAKAMGKKAKGLAKAVVDWIDSRYPERND